jgi:plastin-1
MTGLRYGSTDTFHLLSDSIAAQLNVKLKTQLKSAITTKAGKMTVQGSNANVSHTINEDERREFTNHINLVRSPIRLKTSMFK